MSDGGMSPVKQALLEIRRLRAQLAECRAPEPEPVAIVGLAVRLPGGIVRLDDFWQAIASGENAITATPAERWDNAAVYHPDPDRPGKTYSQHGGFLRDVDQFDAEFFGITPREAESMDPQHRMLLELTWEALEHAGIPPTSLAGTPAGVFIGLSNSDYGRLLLETREAIDAYSSLGLSGSIAAGRISYFLDARGPSLVVDTSCSSSLTAVHLACKSLAAGESSIGIVGASNLILAPEGTISLSHGRMLSPDGQCHTFDASANGYVRGEGFAVVILKRLRDARSDGDRVFAAIRGSAVNHDGRSAGLTAPNGPAQSAVIRAALLDARLTPADVDYVEAHGTGTPLGDPIELQALGSVYGPGRPDTRPLLVGSVKTNIGHLEAAAGLAGLVKVVLSLQHEALPPQRNLVHENPHIDWDSLPVSIVRTLHGWPRGERPRRAGLSGFGFSGTNVHLVLEEAPLTEDGAFPDDQDCLFVISARSSAALRALAVRYVEWLLATDAPLAGICYSAAAGRAHHRHRLAVVARDRIELADALRAWLADDQPGRVRTAFADRAAPSIGFFCPAMNAADAEANAAGLAAASEAFASARDAFAADVSSELPGAPGAYRDQAQVIGLQCALGRFLVALGIAPAAVFGTGAGEFAAASLSGLLAPGDAVAHAVSAPPTKSRLPKSPTPNSSSGAGAFISAATGRVETTWTEGLGTSWDADRLMEAGRAAAAIGVEMVLVLGNDTDRAPALGERQVALLGPPGAAAWKGLLEALLTLYLAGADFTWDALYQTSAPGHRRRKLELPTYAFQRQRFWRPAGRPPPPSAADWRKLVATAALQSETGPLGWDPASYVDRWRLLDELTVGHVINTFAGLGEFASAGARASVGDLVQRHGFVPRHRKLVGRWLNLLAREGLLRQEADVFISPLPLRRRELAGLWHETERLMADDPDLLTYARRASGKLPALLTGQLSPLEVLFAGGSMDTAEGLYERSPSARYLNAIVAAAVRSALADHRGNGPFRLVEAGAGTGGTTSSLADIFPSDGEYWFTDVSDGFLGPARRRFGTNPAFHFARFNLEQPPPAELPIGQADVVLAANVVHATRDLAATLDHLRALLKPGGVLILIEATTHQTIFDLTIGFIEGWSNFADSLRAEHPLLTADRWTSLLCERGFVEAERFPRQGTAPDSIGQHVVIGRNGLAVQPVAAARPAAGAAASPATAAVTPMAERAEVSLEAKAPGLAAPAAERDRVETQPFRDREEVQRFVRHSAARVMMLDPATRPGPRERFTDLGMDSLMALQLRSDLAAGLDLGDRVPATIAFDTGTVEILTEEILRLMDGFGHADDRISGERPNDPPQRVTAEQLDLLSEAEVEALLAQRVLASQTEGQR